MKYEIGTEKLLALLVLFKLTYICAEIAGLYFVVMLLVGALIGAAIGGTIAGGAVLGGVIGGATGGFVGLSLNGLSSIATYYTTKD